MGSVMLRARVAVPARLFNAVGDGKKDSIEHAKALQVVLNGALGEFDVTIKVNTRSVRQARERSGRV